MKTILEKVFQEDSFAVCIKDSTRKVLMQNEICTKTCGDYLNKVCDTGCMKIYAEDQLQQWQNWGSKVYKHSMIHNAYYDITLLCSNDYIITFLQPLQKKYEQALSYYDDINLTKRETQILSYLIKNKPNSLICIDLYISKSTLKTHLNNIYRKIHHSGKSTKYFPCKRGKTSSIVSNFF